MPHNKTKVSLSKHELELVSNARILLTKNEIIGKIYDLFGKMAERYVMAATGVLPEEVFVKPPKISRGENYNGLPYVMLDYPRLFLKEDTFAIRTFFWWGNFFSITIQLSGVYQQLLWPAFAVAAEKNLLDGWYIGVNENKWLHDFTNSNYVIKTGQHLADAMQQNETLKIAKNIPLSQWDNVPDFFETNFELLLAIIKLYAPMR